MVKKILTTAKDEKGGLPLPVALFMAVGTLAKCLGCVKEIHRNIDVIVHLPSFTHV